MGISSSKALRALDVGPIGDSVEAHMLAMGRIDAWVSPWNGIHAAQRAV